jgi:phage-related protein
VAWRLEYHSEKLQEAILSLPPGLLARYIQLTDRMCEYGPDLGMPHSRAMGAGLFELRLQAPEGIGRVFYCARMADRIVMLHQFIKKDRKTPNSDLALARKRLKEWKDADA